MPSCKYQVGQFLRSGETVRPFLGEQGENFIIQVVDINCELDNIPTYKIRIYDNALPGVYYMAIDTLEQRYEPITTKEAMWIMLQY